MQANGGLDNAPVITLLYCARERSPANATLNQTSIRITTTLASNNTLEGTLFTACPITNLIAINTAPTLTTPTTSPISPAPTASPQPGTYHILPIPKIASFTLLSLSPAPRTGTTTPTTPTTTPQTQTQTHFTHAQPPIAPLDLRALTARTANAVARLKALDSKRGRGVGREGQEIFDALGRTLPTRWSEQSTVILDAVFFGSRIGFRVAIRVHAQGQGHGQDRDSRARSVVLGRWRV